MKIQILKSNSKKQFFYLHGINRPIIPQHALKLKKSIETYGVLRPVIVADMEFIDGSMKTYVIEGQHLHSQCVSLGLDIPYIKVDVPNLPYLLKLLSTLNTTSKKWGIQDYITAYAFNNIHYKTLNSILSKYKEIDTSDVISVLMYGYCKSFRAGRVIYNPIINGLFKISNEAEAIEHIQRIKDFSGKFSKLTYSIKRKIVAAYSRYIYSRKELYDHVKFMNKLPKIMGELLLHFVDPDDHEIFDIFDKALGVNKEEINKKRA